MGHNAENLREEIADLEKMLTRYGNSMLLLWVCVPAIGAAFLTADLKWILAISVFVISAYLVLIYKAVGAMADRLRVTNIALLAVVQILDDQSTQYRAQLTNKNEPSK